MQERRLDVRRDETVVPTVLWTPDDARQPAPLVLVGHGGSGHKLAVRVREHAAAFAGAGLATLAIDGPFHGERVARRLGADEYRVLIAAEGVDAVVDRMVADWTAALDVAVAVPTIDGSRLGYLGMSMGARYGLALLAAAGPRFSAAAIGKFGLVQTPAPPPDLNMTARIRSDAPRLALPLLVHAQGDDELFDRTGQLALFDLLGSPDKRLLLRPGPHVETNPEDVDMWRHFLVERLSLTERLPVGSSEAPWRPSRA